MVKGYWSTHPEAYKRHKKRCAMNSKAYALNHPQKAKEWQIKAGKKHRLKLKIQIFEILGNKCVRCGFSDSRALQIDHVNGHGNLEVKQFRNRELYYKHILAKIESGSKDYQLLCANCNWIKKCGEPRIQLI